MKKEILLKSLPVFLSSILNILSLMLRTAILSYFGIEFVGSMALANNFLLFFVSFYTSIHIAANAFLSKHHEIPDNRKFAILLQGIGFITIIVFFAFTPLNNLYLKFIDIQDNEFIAQYFIYMKIINWLIPLEVLVFILNAFMIFYGKDWKSFKIRLIADIFNLTILAFFSFYKLLSGHQFLIFVGIIQIVFCLYSLIAISCNLIPLISRITIKDFYNNYVSIKEIIINILYAGGGSLLVTGSAICIMLLCAKISIKAAMIMGLLLALSRLIIIPSRILGFRIGHMAAKKFNSLDFKLGNKYLTQGMLFLSYVIFPLSILMIFFPHQLTNVLYNKIVFSDNDIMSFRLTGMALLFDPLSSFLSSALQVNNMIKHVNLTNIYYWAIDLPLCWLFGIYYDYQLVGICSVLLFSKIIMSLLNLVILRTHNKSFESNAIRC